MKHPIITIRVKGFGDMTAELYPETAPATVENFLALARRGFFDGLIFHRVIPHFMIQGGGYTEKFEHREAGAIRGEFAANGFGQNKLHHARGVLSMARTNDPNSASSQFFIMHADADYLDGQYAAFGRVTAGEEIIDRIAAQPTTSRGYMDDVPVKPVVIETIAVVEE